MRGIDYGYDIAKRDVLFIGTQFTNLYTCIIGMVGSILLTHLFEKIV